MRLTTLCKIILTSSLNDGIFYIILSIPHNTIIDMNNVMICFYGLCHRQEMLWTCLASLDVASRWSRLLALRDAWRCGKKPSMCGVQFSLRVNTPDGFAILWVSGPCLSTHEVVGAAPNRRGRVHGTIWWNYPWGIIYTPHLILI